MKCFGRLVFLLVLLVSGCKDGTAPAARPTLRVTLPADGQSITTFGAADSVVVAGSVAFPTGKGTLTWSIDSRTPAGVSLPSVSTGAEIPFSFAIHDLEGGAHTIHLVARDAGGGVAELKTSLSVARVALAEILISPASPMVGVEGLALRAVIRDSSGSSVSGPAIRWRSSDPGIISVDSLGNLTVQAPTKGQDQVEIVAEAARLETRVIAKVSPPAPYGYAVINPSHRMLLGKQRRISAVRVSGTVVGFTPERWFSTDSTVVSISPDGLLTARRPGRARIGVRGTHSYGGTMWGGAEVNVVETGGYRVTELGSLGNGVVRPLGLNDRGQVVGEERLPSGRTQAFSWSGGNMVDLGSSSESSSAADVNNEGIVVGYSSPSTSGDFRAVRWREGGMEALEGTGGGNRAVDINDAGTIVVNIDACSLGCSLLWSGPNQVDSVAIVKETSTLTCRFRRIARINDAGDLIGTDYCGIARRIGEDVDYAGCYYCSRNEPADISNGGVGLVSVYSAQATQAQTASLWKGAVHRAIEGRARSYYPRGMNEREEVAGNVDGSAGFVWERGETSYLTDLVRGSYTITDATGINESGQIIATGRDAAGREVGLLLTPE